MRTTDSDHEQPVYPHLVPEVKLTGTDQLWVAEEVYLNDYHSLAEARVAIDTFIHDVYNDNRLHSASGYLPPTEFEQALSIPHLP